MRVSVALIIVTVTLFGMSYSRGSMRFIPVKQTLDMQFEGEPTTDRFNNIIPGVSEWRPVKVAQWWVDKTEEREGDSILRTVDTIHVHLPVENVPPSWGRIRKIGRASCRERV